MNRLLFCTLCTLTAVVSAAELKSPGAPFVEKKGDIDENLQSVFSASEISKGNKAFVWQNQYENIQIIDSGKKVMSQQIWGAPSVPSWAPFEKFTSKTDETAKNVTRTAPFRITNTAGGKFIQKISLLPDGKIRVDQALNYDKENVKFKNLTQRFCFPAAFLEKKTIEVDGKRYTFPERAKWNFDRQGKASPWINAFFAKDVRKMIINKGDSSEIALEMEGKPFLVVFRGKDGAFFHLSRKDKLPSGFLLDLGKSAKQKSSDCIVEGVNYSNTNALDVPRFADRNWFINPSFESGERYFYAPCRDLSAALSTDAHSGKYAMSGQFFTFHFPLRANRDYVLSVYAKSKDGAKRNFAVRAHGIRCSKNIRFTAGKEWKRFEFAFRLPSTVTRFYFSGKDVLFDDLQIEPGTKASAYAGNRIGIELATASPEDGLVDEGKKIDARLIVRGPMGSKGKIEAVVTDFFGRKLLDQTLNFNLGAKREAVLPFCPDSVFPKGISTIRLTVKADGQKEYTDYLRLTKMKYADGTKKHRILHGSKRYGGFWNSFLQAPDRELEILKYSGVGNHSYLGNLWTKETYDRLAKYGMTSLGNYIPYSNNKFFKDYRPMMAGEPLLIDGKKYETAKQYSPEFLKRVEKLAYKQAKMWPHVTYWTSATEPGEHIGTLGAGNDRDYAKFTLAINRGLKKANPAIRYNPFGAWNMAEQGRKRVLDFLRLCRKLEPETSFSAIDIHVYRAHPEMPDTDMEFDLFKKGLAELGYKDIPVMWGEGAYFYPMIMPQWNISPWAGVGDKDAYYLMHLPGYDLGWGEKVGAAMTMRHNLMAYKNADRLLNSCPWGPDLIDNKTPFASLVTISVLTDLLGNADFKKELRFAPGARCYIFDDNAGNAVAALWQFSEELDFGTKNGSPMTLDMKSIPDAEFIDMMGNRCSTVKKGSECTIPLTNYPVFIRVKKPYMAALEKAVNGSLVENGLLPIGFAAKIKSRNEIEIDAVNTLSRRIKGEISIDGQPMRKIDLASLGSNSFLWKLNTEMPFGRITKLNIPLLMKSGNAVLRDEFKLETLPVKYVPGNRINWNAIPSIRLEHLHLENYAVRNQIPYGGKKDFAASFQAAWNESGFYLRIEADDDKLFADPKKEPRLSYCDDAVQVFFDTLGDARDNARRGRSGRDLNDYGYELIPRSENSGIVYRRDAPDHQLTGGASEGLKPNTVEKGVKFTFSYRNGKRIYDVFFPKRYLMPMVFANGSTPGIGIKVYDRDSAVEAGGKQSFSNVRGTDANSAPHLYTQLLFVK